MSSINWSGLLKWSLSYSDGTAPTSRLNEEDISFLQGAIQEALSSVEDPSKLITEAIEKLSDSNESVIITAIELIEKCVDFYPETARQFDRLNAMEPLLHVLSSRNEDIVERSFQIMAFIFSNNPTVQQHAYEKKALPILMEFLETTPSTKLAIRCLGAISALIRNIGDAEKDFVESNGLKALVIALNSENTKYQEKAMTLSRHFLDINRFSYENIENLRFVDATLCILNTRKDETMGIQHGELCAHMVNALIQNHRIKLARCGDLEKLRSSIGTRLEYIKSLESQLDLDMSEEKVHLESAFSKT
ncbi:hypothetical protein IE077_003858, partial [Cardiosporidium cionae]